MVRDLTVWQMRTFRDAQARRVERMSKDAPAAAPAAVSEGRPPPRAAMVESMIELGYTRAAAEASYDRQVKQWEAGRAQP